MRHQKGTETSLWLCSGDGSVIAALLPDTCQVITWMAGSRTFAQTCQADTHSCKFGGSRHERLAIASPAACCLWSLGKRGDLIKEDVDIQVQAVFFCAVPIAETSKF